ncbi:sugar phosphate isomerase/epimerase family protein [Ulvibacterium sp.]|uniref:sugar phosphate isomerase/epimerase family protein n=1 Tax=Ulvibacterium sp. TaxID=2665914 RepID=UPI003BAD8B7D
MAQGIGMDNIYAWCIVPYDRLERSPEARIAMLKKMGITKYAYDWREEHLAQMAEELQWAKKQGVKVISVWMWIDARGDTLGKLSDSNEKVFEVIEEVDYKGQIWVSFAANFFEGLSNSEAVAKGTEMIAFLSKRATALGCKIGLYNHGDWFGEPRNQIQIIKALPDEDLGLVYNFHHAHHQIDAFPEMIDTILPYLWYVNLSGLRKEGPKILTIGEGDYEKEMIQLLLEKGYTGDFGILGHVAEKDVELVLKANLNGLRRMNFK